MNGLFQNEAVFFSLMAHTKTLRPVWKIDWGAVDQRGKDNILRALTGDEQFMASENEREQC
jgi:hypothetical protein